jgi:hypothetical protein
MKKNIAIAIMTISKMPRCMKGAPLEVRLQYSMLYPNFGP